MMKFAVATLGLVLAATPAAADPAPCTVDASLQPLCVDADTSCILDGQVHVCLSQIGSDLGCLLSPLGINLGCLSDQLACTHDGVVEVCNATDDSCAIDIDGTLTCLTGQVSCLLDATVYACASDGSIDLCVSLGGDFCTTPDDGCDDDDDCDCDDGGDDSGDDGSDDSSDDVSDAGDDWTGPTFDDDSSGGDDGDLGPDDNSGGDGTDGNADGGMWASGGGCSTGGGSGSFGVAVLALGAVLARRRRRQAGMLVAAVSTIATPAVADTINADSLRANSIGQGGIAVANTDTLGAYQLRASLFGSYANNPLELRDDNGQRMMGVIDDLSTVDLRVGMGLPHHFELSVLAPFVVDQRGEAGLESRAIGDISIAAKWSARRGRAGVAVMPELVAPTGSGEFTTDGAWSALGTVLADVRFGPLTVGGLAGGRLRGESETFMGARTDDEVRWGGMADLTLDQGHDVHFVGEVFGAVGVGDAARATTAEALGSMRVRAGDWMVVAGAGAGLAQGVGTPAWRGFIGAAYTIDTNKQPRAKPMPPPPAVIEDEEPPPAPIVEIVAIPEPVVVEEPPAAPPPAYVFTKEHTIVFHDIHFATAKWKILPDSFSVLDNIAESLRQQPEVRIRIEGHTDARGGERYNLLLSQQRGLAVMNYLIAAGIDPSRLDYAGFGISQPIAPNNTKDNRALNRRVEIRTIASSEVQP